MTQVLTLYPNLSLLLLMKYYRIRVIVQGRLYIETIKAKDLDSAFKIWLRRQLMVF